MTIIYVMDVNPCVRTTVDDVDAGGQSVKVKGSIGLDLKAPNREVPEPGADIEAHIGSQPALPIFEPLTLPPDGPACRLQGLPHRMIPRRGARMTTQAQNLHDDSR